MHPWNPSYLLVCKHSPAHLHAAAAQAQGGFQLCSPTEALGRGGLPGRGSGADLVSGTVARWLKGACLRTESERKLDRHSSYRVVPTSAEPICSANLGDGRVLAFTYCYWLSSPTAPVAGAESVSYSERSPSGRHPHPETLGWAPPSMGHHRCHPLCPDPPMSLHSTVAQLHGGLPVGPE